MVTGGDNMTDKHHDLVLPTQSQLRQAIEMYLALSYGPVVPPGVAELRPPEGVAVADYLMSERVERTPSGAAMEEVRSFAIRLGNSEYPHMKLKISCPPSHRTFLLSVDAHDAFLQATAGSADYAALEQLKVHNAAMASAICAAWDAAGLPTEKSFLRMQIEQARLRNGKRDHADPRPPTT